VLVDEARRAWRPLVVCDVPLLFERRHDGPLRPNRAGGRAAPVRLERLVRERGLRETEAMDMIVAQMPAELKRARADHIIDNDGTLTALDKRVTRCGALVQKRRVARTGHVPDGSQLACRCSWP
jgi:dephospho-CoA kinase